MNKSSLVFLYLLVASWLIFIVPALYEDMTVNTTFKETTCQILDKRIDHGMKYFHPLIQLKYTDNKTGIYSVWAPASRTHANIRTNEYANEILNKFSANQVIPCWYNPNHPITVYAQQGYTLEMWVYLICTIGFLVLMTLLSLLNDKPETTNRYAPHNSNDLFAIKENKYTMETIYQGDKPLTADLLPQKYQKLSPQYKDKIVAVFNKNGKIVALKPFYSKIFVGTLMLMAILMLGMIFYNMLH